MIRKKRSKSYFNLFLKKFMFTALIPCVTIIFLYMQTEHVVKNQIMISNESVLTQFFQQVDLLIEEMKENVVSVVSDTTCKNYALYAAYQPEKAPYQSYVVMKMLSKLPLDKYYDAFVYFPESDQVISGFYGSVNSDYYYKSHYQALENGTEFYEKFQSILNCNLKSVTLHTLNGKNGETYLCITMKRFNYKDVKLNYIAVLVLKPTYVEQFMLGMDDKHKGTMLMFDGNKELLLTSDKETSIDTLEGHAGKAGTYEINFENKDYMIQIQSSDAVDAYYAFATPIDYFWEQLSQLRFICSLGGFLIVFISVRFAYKGAKSSYQPIEEVIGRLQTQTESVYDAKENSELEFIEEILKRQGREKKTLHKKLKSSESMQIEKMLLFLLYGNGDGAAIQNEDVRASGMELYTNRFLVSVLKFENANGLEPNLLLFMVKNIFMELFGSKGKSYVASISAEQYVILFNPDELSEKVEMTEILKKGKNFLEENYSLTLTIGISNVHDDIRGISTAYEEAEQAIRYKYLLGEGRIIRYSEIAGREFKYSVDVESKLSRMIMAYVSESENSESVGEFSAKVMEIYSINEKTSMETVECFKFEMMSAVNKALISGDCFDEENKEMLKKLLTSPTLNEFQNCFCHLLKILKEQVTQGGVCKCAYQYIQENYRNPELSVTKLGEKFRISPSYLSKLFKEKYEVNLLDYIAQTRVQNAKLDLRETDKSVQQIAEENGFLSSNVFIKVFKKWEGITPGAYRKLVWNRRTDSKR